MTAGEHRNVESRSDLFIGGTWVRPEAQETIEVVSPHTEEVVARVAAAGPGLPLHNMGVLAGLAESYPWQERRPGAFGQEVLLRRDPVGVVGAVVPWNMPQFLIVAKMIPALLAGCTVVVKAAPESPLDALLLAELLEQVDLPSGVVSILPGGRDAGATLVGHAGVDKVSFTGSTAAGREVATACAQNLTKVSLELGGKSAAIALDDADPAVVAEAVSRSAMGMSGQICNALTRVVVPAGRAEEFADALASVLSALPIGDPRDPATQVGPLVSRRQQERARSYIEQGVHDGARVVTGGAKLPPGQDRGWYVQPTVFAGVDNGMTIAREEIFGPVFTVIPYRDEADAVRIANDSEYGLAGSAQ